MTIQLKNNAVGFLSAGVSATATLLVLQSGEGANFPTLVPSQFFYVTLASTSGATEIVKVTGRSGDSMTVQRAQENTTAMSFPALSRVELRVTAQAVYDVIDAAISGTTTAVSNIASVIAVAASIDSVNTVTSNLASVINVSNNIGDINLVENSLTNVNIVAANMADINAVSDDLAAVNAVADDIDDLVTNLEDIVAVGGSINSVVTVANNIASVNAVNSNSTNVNTVAGSIGNVNTVATNIAAVQTVSTNIASVNAVNSNSANVNTVAGSIANVNTTATNIASVNTAATNIVAIQTAPAQATAAANSASAAATSATNAAASATAAAASAVTAVNAPGTSGTSTTSLTINTGSQTFTTQTGKAWVVGQFVTVASTASPTNFLYGQITAYNSGTGSMTVNVLSVGGSGTLASWTIGLVGPNATLTDQNSLQPVTLTLPSIRPSLLLDFANSKKLDPRITFTRATSGTYYDGVTSAKAEENLLRESQVFLPTAWALTDADPTGTLGSDVVINGSFSTDTNWSKGTGWSISGGTANASNAAGFLAQTNAGSLTVGKLYNITFTVSNYSSGSVRPYIGYNPTFGTAVSANGTYSQDILYTDPFTAEYGMYSNTSFTGSVDNISVKELTVTYVTAPDGTTTATEFTADAANATFTQSVTAIAAEYTFSVYLRRVTGTGDIDITAHSGGTWVTQTITSSWARYTVTQTLTAGTRTPGIRIVTSGDQIEVWGAQLEQRSAATVYTPTTTQPITNYVPQLLTVPANTPRFDHNPTTGESLGLLVEEQRTNLLTYSEDFSNATWAKSNASVDSNVVVAPDGVLTADLVIDTTANTEHYVGQSFSCTSGLAYTFSGYVKQKPGSYTTCVIRTWLTGSVIHTVDFAAGTITGGGTLTSVGNGWYRFAITRTASATGVAYIDSYTKQASAYTGTGFDGHCVWGFQLEAGAFATSYIPTVAATVTRTADAPSMTGVNFSSWYRQDEGTMYAELQRLVANAQISYVAGTGNLNATNSMYALLLNNGNTQFSSSGGISITGGQIGADAKKTCAAYKANDNAWVINGSVIGTDTSSSPGVVADTILFGGAFPIANNCGYYRKLAYYPKRLTNAQLQALTA